ncbi:MAG TPA: hypothetical protein VKJ47_12765, partial [Candidatus Binatia bacterium]|nr:hypothetical protein [Candidatus Binatia bacterium]
MRYHKQRLTVSLPVLTFLIATFIPPGFAQAATITVVNLDGPGEGLNDPTVVSPVGGNPGTTVGAQRLKALQFAADLWGTRLKSGVEIRVDAHFDPFNDPSLPCKPDSGPIGGAGPTTLLRGFSGAPAPNMWFPVALANNLAGVDLDPTHDDIDAQFNSSVGTAGCLTGTGFYYGFDGSPAANEIDFVSIVLHELAHGLGFETFVDLKSGAKLMGFDDTFMRFLEDHSTGKLYPAMTNAERVSASMNTGNLHWVGANVVAAGSFLIDGRDPASGHVEMFAPNPQQPGSSVTHFSDALFPDELMGPVYTGPNHTINLTAQLLEDIGWQTTTGTQQNLENPQPDSSQSGISVISGWVCDAQSVRLLID